MTKKFYEMSVEERWQKLKEMGISENTLQLLRKPTPLEKLDLAIENVIGFITLPVGLLFIRVNGEDKIVPMAIEEPSVVAAANKAAKMSLPAGFQAKSEGNVMIGQIQIKGDVTGKLDKEKIEAKGKELGKRMEKYGGGWRGCSIRVVNTYRGPFTLVEILIDTADAMGANTVNTIAEELGTWLAEEFEVEYRMRIISNLAIYRKVKATAVWSYEKIEEDIKKKSLPFTSEEIVERFLDGYALTADIFRRTTNNKGIMNGVDAVAIAAGQDWRAIEAGAHAYSAITEMPLANYWKEKDGLHGIIELPLAVGTVGGATKTLDHAKAALEMMKVKHSFQLAEIMASVGLANNFAAIYAIVTEGIQAGHMKLHAKHLAILAGAKTRNEIIAVQKELAKLKNYSVEKAKEILEKIRGGAL